MKRMIRFLSEFGVFVLLCITVISSAWAGAGEMVILAFGDSITYGMGSSSDGPQTGYPILLEKKLSALFPENFTVINVGVPGEATLWGSERFSSVINTYQPDLILLMEGTNDCVFNTPFLDIENNLRSMIQIARDQGIPVVIATIPPVITNAYADRTQQMDNIMAFNPRIYAI
ncbi:MAG TPA: GDSL-type esterase/lipase family protein, partial [Thermodesulfobacteriota bacterium]|nr:GDSL-type esterase/lipase family protein [Thermodesulfobacteriota bacterium]